MLFLLQELRQMILDPKIIQILMICNKNKYITPLECI